MKPIRLGVSPIARVRDQQPTTMLPAAGLWGGITQQSPDQALPTQVKDALNTDSDVFDGCRKRAGTELDRLVSQSSLALDTNSPCRLHDIRRSASEEYRVVFNRNGSNMRVRAFQAGNNTECAVTFNSGTNAYLIANSATAADLRFTTLGDRTIVVNTKVVPALLTSPTYTVARTYKNADVMVASGPINGTYHRALLDGQDLQAGYYQYNIGTKTFPTFTNAPASFSGWPKLRGDWDVDGSDPKRVRLGFSRFALADSGLTAANVSGDTWTLTKTNTFATYTFEPGDQIRITGGTGVTFASGSNGWVTVVSKDTSSQITVTDANGIAYRPGTSAALAAAADISFSGIGREYQLEKSFATLINNGTIVDMDDIASELTKSFREQGEADATIGWIPDSSGGYGSFRVTGPWQGVDATIYTPQPPTTGAGGSGDLTVAGRPFSSTGTIVPGSGGSPGPATRLAIASRWASRPAPNQPEYLPDATTFPVSLTRSTPPSGATPGAFTVETIPWQARQVGDEVTNKVPDAFKSGQGFSAVAFHEERLVLSSGRFVAMSEANNFFNNYLKDDTNLVDSDRINREITGKSVGEVTTLTNLRRTLIANTTAGQLFEFAAEGGWSPTSVTATSTVQLETLGVPPVVMDDRFYFVARQYSPTGGRVACTIQEYAYDDQRAQNATQELTAHVPLFFEDDIVRLVGAPMQRTLLLWNEQDRRTIYTWRSFFGPGNQRAQSAWNKYRFPAGSTVLDACLLLDGVNFLILTNSGNITFERMRFEPDVTDAEKAGLGAGAFPRRLDRSVASVGVWNGTNTEFNLAAAGVSFSDADMTRVVTAAGVEYTSTVVGTKAVVAGVNLDTLICRIGAPFESKVTLMPIVIKDQGVPFPGRYVHVVDMNLSIRRSGTLNVKITPENGIGRTVTIAPASGVINERESVLVGVGASNNHLDMEISSTDAKPMVLLGVQYNVRPIPGTQRVF